jgi:hypothetical protein
MRSKSIKLSLLLCALCTSFANAGPYTGKRWNISSSSPNVTYTIDSTAASLAQNIRDSFTVWQNVSGAYITFSEAASGGQIVVKVGGVTTSWAAGEAQYQYDSSGHIYTCEIRLSSGATNSTIIHEIGHCTGLNHSEVANAVMSYRRDSTSSSNLAVTRDDEYAISVLYPTGNTGRPIGCGTLNTSQNAETQGLLQWLIFFLMVTLAASKRLGELNDKRR